MESEASPFPEGERWFCVRTKRLFEKIAASALRSEMGVDVFCPMIQFERARGSGKVRVTEALFPNYVFSRFDYAATHRRIRAARGVLKIVGFGGCPVPVDETIISSLREAVSEQETILLDTSVDPGDEVQVIGGPFGGLKAVVTRVMPAKERVAILLELLGTVREVEVPLAFVLPEAGHPLRS
jgi:transcriptional antiterminator RfaH